MPQSQHVAVPCMNLKKKLNLFKHKKSNGFFFLVQISLDEIHLSLNVCYNMMNRYLYLPFRNCLQDIFGLVGLGRQLPHLAVLCLRDVGFAEAQGTCGVG